jgi:hypothetical protein
MEEEGFHESQITIHESRKEEEKTPGSSGGCKPGAGGMRQRQGRNKLVSLLYAERCAAKILVHDDAGPIVLLHRQNHWLVDVDVPAFSDAEPHRAV